MRAPSQRVRLKYVCEGGGSYGLNISASDYVEKGVRLIRTSDLAGGRLANEDDAIFVPHEAVGPEDLLRRDDLLLSRSGTIGRAFLVPAEAAGATHAGFLVRFRIRSGVAPRYVFYCTQSADFQSSIRAEAITSTIQNFNAERYNNLSIPLPPLPEQRSIADYLDREAVRLDTLLDEQHHLIRLLRLRRRAVIDHAMVSGAEYLKFSRMFSFHNGDRGASYPSRDQFVPQGVPFVNAGHLEGGSVSYEGMNYVTPEKYSEMGGAKLCPGDVLFCLRGSLGKFGLFEGRDGGALASSLVAMRLIDSGRLDLRYFLYFLASSRMADAIRLVETGTAQPNLSVEQLARLNMPLPSVETQQSISGHLDEQTGKIDTLIAETDRFIELAQERRSALITAAVTGQIDLGEAA